MAACDFCGSPVERHDPVTADHGGETYRFCNWACLAEYVDRESLATGASCEWRPTDAE